MSILVVAAYHCEVAGKPTGSVDYQVRYFDADSLDEVMVRLRSEKPVAYKNVYKQEVRWVFDGTMADELNPKLQDGRLMHDEALHNSSVILLRFPRTVCAYRWTMSASV